MSLIHTCELNGVNPFDYLTELQRRSAELSAHPQSGCRGTFATHWQGSQHPRRRNIKVRLDGRNYRFRPSKNTRENARTTHLQTSKIQHGFGQPRKPAKMLRAGLYARVSTLDQQTLPMQMRAMRDYAANRGWTVTCKSKKLAPVPRRASSANN